MWLRIDKTNSNGVKRSSGDLRIRIIQIGLIGNIDHGSLDPPRHSLSQTPDWLTGAEKQKKRGHTRHTIGFQNNPNVLSYNISVA